MSGLPGANGLPGIDVCLLTSSVHFNFSTPYFREHPDFQERKDTLASVEKQDFQANKEYQEFQDEKGNQELQDTQEYLVHPDLVGYP